MHGNENHFWGDDEDRGKSLVQLSHLKSPDPGRRRMGNEIFRAGVYGFPTSFCLWKTGGLSKLTLIYWGPDDFLACVDEIGRAHV